MSNFLFRRELARPRLPFIALLVLPCLLCSTARAQSPDDEIVRINTDLVVLNAAVVDSQGHFAHGLQAADFRVLEDGREQKIASFGAEETPFAAAVLLDTSGSMEARMSLGRAAAIRFLEGLREDDVAAVYSFDSKITQLQEFSPSRDLAPLAFGIRARGMTMLNDAIYQAATDLAQRPEKRRAIIVLSDGGENFSRASSTKSLERALAAGATIYTVDMSSPDGGMRDAQGSAILRDYAVKSGGRYVATPGGPTLREAFASISEELGQQYTITYQSSNRAHDGKWRTVDVKLSRPQLTARTRKGYRAPRN